jgi:uncharacterized protein (DUF305 family)
MNKSSIVLALVIGLIVGFTGASAFQKDTFSMNTGMMHQMPNGMPNGSMMRNEMSGMMSGLSGKRGDEFDRAFLTEMIMHHEGAVTMAEAALKDAKHQEIMTMAHAIITAQTGEIAQMKAWLKTWYGIETATTTN